MLAQVHAFTQLVLDPSEGPSYALPRRFAPQPEFPVSGLAAEVRHSQKFEGFRLALTTVLPILIREPSELDEPGFVGVQGQPEPGQPLPQVVQVALRFPPMLKAGHEIVRVTDNDHVAFHLPLAP